MVTNAFAKGGLFWLSEMLSNHGLKAWSALRREMGLLICFGLFVVALAGLPPFPAFFAKWETVKLLIAYGRWVWLVPLLLGTLFEAGYLFRWLGFATKSEGEEMARFSVHRFLPAMLAGAALLIAAYHVGNHTYNLRLGVFYPVVGLLGFAAIDRLSAKLKGLLAMVALAAFAWIKVFPQMTGLGKMFCLIFIGASVAQIIAYLNRKGRAEGLFPLLVMMILSMGNLLRSHTPLEFFFAWELMTVSSYLLILRGRKAEAPALSYIMFSLGSALLLMTALLLMSQTGTFLFQQTEAASLKLVPVILAGLAFLTKTGALGLHVWLPGAYAEAEDETTALISSVLSKAGIFGMILLLLSSLHTFLSYPTLMIVLGWIGVLTALGGALLAVFEEDAKRLLAYSSMSQIGYIVLGLSLMSHLGWVSAFYLTLNHVLIKAMIFIAMAGVFLRTGTRYMYEMGGLIKKMPVSFLSVLMGIIALSGVPPLSGFGSKWFIYTSLLESGRYLQAGVAFFASAVAFLYLYKLIHTIFLGQPKPQLSQVKEAPVWYLLPQVGFMLAIMLISFLPNIITLPISKVVGSYIPKPEWLHWKGYTIWMDSPLLKGYWNGNLIMLVTMGVFMVPLIWLLLVNARAQKVKQFNIVYAAERPFKPWTTHFAYNMFAHYYKALGFWVKPRIQGFWNGTSEWTHSLSATLARLYTGNGQTYMLHIFLYVIVLYFLMGVAK